MLVVLDRPRENTLWAWQEVHWDGSGGVVSLFGLTFSCLFHVAEKKNQTRLYPNLVPVVVAVVTAEVTLYSLCAVVALYSPGTICSSTRDPVSKSLPPSSKYLTTLEKSRQACGWPFRFLASYPWPFCSPSLLIPPLTHTFSTHPRPLFPPSVPPLSIGWTKYTQCAAVKPREHCNSEWRHYIIEHCATTHPSFVGSPAGNRKISNWSNIGRCQA